MSTQEHPDVVHSRLTGGKWEHLARWSNGQQYWIPADIMARKYGYCQVDAIVGKRFMQGSTQYCVRWRDGKGQDGNGSLTWEPLETLSGSAKLVKEFEEKVQETMRASGHQSSSCQGTRRARGLTGNSLATHYTKGSPRNGKMRRLQPSSTSTEEKSHVGLVRRSVSMPIQLPLVDTHTVTTGEEHSQDLADSGDSDSVASGARSTSPSGSIMSDNNSPRLMAPKRDHNNQVESPKRCGLHQRSATEPPQLQFNFRPLMYQTSDMFRAVMGNLPQEQLSPALEARMLRLALSPAASNASANGLDRTPLSSSDVDAKDVPSTFETLGARAPGTSLSHHTPRQAQPAAANAVSAMEAASIRNLTRTDPMPLRRLNEHLLRHTARGTQTPAGPHVFRFRGLLETHKHSLHTGRVPPASSSSHRIIMSSLDHVAEARQRQIRDVVEPTLSSAAKKGLSQLQQWSVSNDNLMAHDNVLSKEDAEVSALPPFHTTDESDLIVSDSADDLLRDLYHDNLVQ